MSPFESTRESARALTHCLADENERRRILSALIRERATALAFELLKECEPQPTTEEMPV